MAPDFEEIANLIMKELKNLGIECYLWDVSKWQSVYIRFNDPRMCTIRIANHNGIKKWKVKYNLRSDMGLKDKKWKKEKNIWRLFMPVKNWKELIPILVERYSEIQTWEGRTTYTYKYGIPEFKRELASI